MTTFFGWCHEKKRIISGVCKYASCCLVRLSLSTGKADGLRVNHVVGTLAHYADIPGHTIGKIRIQDRQTLVDVPEQFVGRVLANTRTYRIGKQAVTIERV